MSPTRRRWTIVLGLLLILAVVLGCSAPSRLLGESPLATLVQELPGDEESEPGPELPLIETVAPEPVVVTHQGGAFHVYSLDGSLVETRPAEHGSGCR
jgi:hypothetical protein